MNYFNKKIIFELYQLIRLKIYQNRPTKMISLLSVISLILLTINIKIF